MRFRRGKTYANVPRRRQATPDGMVEDRPLSTFRRNRTLVGSISARVSSANELGGDLRSPRAHVHHLNAHRRRLGSTLAMVMLASGALLWLLYEFTASVHISPTSGGLIVQNERYDRAINDYLNGRPLERLRSLLNEKALEEYLAQVTPEVSEVRINGASGLATSHFDLTFRKPVAGWLINSQQYYVDKNGVPFRLNYFERPIVKIVDQSGIPQTTGTPVASGRFLNYVGRAVELARLSNLIVEQAIIPANTTRQIELRIAKHNYPIKLSLDRVVGEQIEDMVKAIQYFDGRQITPQYIDVRVSGKAYYR